MRASTWIVIAGVAGATGVALGAFAAHALPGVMENWRLPPDEIARRMETFQIGVRYQMYHALALLAVGILAGNSDSVWLRVAGLAFLVGLLVFSGLLYALVLTGVKILGAMVPIGGLSLIVGWAALAASGWTLRRSL